VGAGPGIPIAAEVFTGNSGEPATMASRVTKLEERFDIERVGWVSDRGMLTAARIEQVLRPKGQDWISGLPAPQITQLAAEHDPFQPSLFDERNLSELASEQSPGERLIVCRNAPLAQEPALDRLELLATTGAQLAKIAAATQRASRALRGEQAIAWRVGRVVDCFHMARHFHLVITDTSRTWMRKADAIAAEAVLDRLCVIRTSLGAE
jgi:hypothetical protein